MEIEYTLQAKNDLLYWKNNNNIQINKRIFDLIQSIKNDYKNGIGKPEFLKHIKVWSRRINQEHRITYNKINNNTILIYSLKGHY